MYDPTVGRFLTEDPSGFDGGDANLYRYVNNSPLNFTDPTGLRQAGNPLDALSGGFGSNTINPVSNFGLSSGTIDVSSILPSTAFHGFVQDYVGASPAVTGLNRQIFGLQDQVAALQANSFGHLNGRNRQGAITANRNQISSLGNQISQLTASRPALQAQVANAYATSLFGTQPTDFSHNPDYASGIGNISSLPTSTFGVAAANPYVVGSTQIVGGGIEAGIGVLGVAAFAEPVSTVGGAIAVGHGLDTIGAGFSTIYNGSVQNSLTQRGVTAGLTYAGVDPVVAGYVGTGVDIGVGIGSGVAASRVFRVPTVAGEKSRRFVSFLDAGLGDTDPFGNALVSRHGTTVDRLQTAIHENVHSFFSPRKLGPLATRRATTLGVDRYNASQFVQFSEEAIAESFAQIGTRNLTGLSFRQAVGRGLSLPFNGNYTVVRGAADIPLTVGGVAREVGIGSSIYAGSLFGANQIGNFVFGD